MNNISILLKSLSEVALTLLVVVLVAVSCMLLFYVLLKRTFRSKYALAYVLVIPAFIGLALLVLYPIGYNVYLAFTNMSLRRFTAERGMQTGLKFFFENIRLIFAEPVLKQQYFFPVLARTGLWTAIQITTHVSLGMVVALLLNRPMKMRGAYRALLLFPWAIPQIIAVLAFRGEFNYSYGYINTFLAETLHLQPVPWLSNEVWNFVAINLTNIWLGVPFMAVILLGGLQSIDPTYYEVAEIDGASAFKRFTKVTIPLIKPVMVPAVILGIIWTFNNFNVPFFINQQELESSDILVTALFRAAFQYNRYGFSATFAILIFLILLGLTLLFLRLGRPDIQFETKSRQQAVGE